MAEPLLTIQGVTVRFGGLTAVDGVSATLQVGELIGIIGPNGAGKTTFFNAISGVQPVTAVLLLRPDQRVQPGHVAGVGHVERVEVQAGPPHHLGYACRWHQTGGPACRVCRRHGHASSSEWMILVRRSDLEWGGFQDAG